ncbi:hypothetical protein HXX76_012996 [Chlamydomonas incerta]|uniref:PGG domain-containing protein n=1 Tax=Chlamydomonas incerta TaxID=51695 RepID=A0A835VVI3_CHLIN|nr:hypothetical protein HXX76_012996 [Chlamydomonas incerta]|eukprot:KAG2426686.1 hypothetical protein HXX76_012996 [Chlamydomonas incerta]
MNVPTSEVIHGMLAGRYWGALARCTTPLEAKERLKYIWGTLALISALFSALTMPTVTSPPGPDDATDARVQAYVVLFFTALILSFVVIMTTMGMMATLDYCATSEDILEYVDNFAWYSELIYTVFIGSFLSMLAGVLVYAHYKYPPRVFWAITAIYVGLAVVNSYAVVRVDLWARARVARRGAALQRLAAAGGGAGGAGAGGSSGSGNGNGSRNGSCDDKTTPLS